MNPVASLVLVSGILAGAEPFSYEQAFKEAQSQRRPLLVLVGATWCPACQTMKQQTLPRLASRGGLAGVSYATIDADAQPELAAQLLRGNSVPQLIAFSRQPGGKWQREQLTGSASEAAIQGLIARSLKVQKGEPAAEPAGAIGGE
jgi:thioredoxin-like negative regulator of GroEL